MFFNKESSWTWDEWYNSRVYNILYNLNSTIWVPENIMTSEEKEKHPEYKTTEGYLKAIPYKEAYKNLWNNLNDDSKKEVMSLPNFNKKVFEDITGIKL